MSETWRRQYLELMAERDRLQALCVNAHAAHEREVEILRTERDLYAQQVVELRGKLEARTAGDAEPTPRAARTRPHVRGDVGQATIRERIASTYKARGVAMFVPEQFVSAGIGDMNTVLKALDGLVRDRYLEAEAEVKCAEGHVYWSGDLPTFDGKKNRLTMCRREGCPTRTLTNTELEDEDNQPRVFVSYTLTKIWKDVLDSEKKSPATRS